MKTLTLFLGAALLLAIQPVQAEDTQQQVKEHQMNVHGAVCPGCAIGLERRFMSIDGVKGFDINFKSGLVKVCANESVVFLEEDMTQLFRDFGYLYKGEEIQDTCTL